MQTQRDNPSLRWPLLLLTLLGLVLPSAISKTLSSKEVLLRAVDEYNKKSLDTNLYRFLDMDSQPPWNEDPDTPKYVNFRVKETVCEKSTYQIPELCNFKEHGIVKRCVGTVILNQDTESFDIDCQGPETQPQPVTKLSWIAKLLRRGGQKIGEKFKKLGQKIEDYFQKNAPQAEN